MESTYNSLKARCAELGISLRDLCQRAGVPVKTLYSWRYHENWGVQTLRKLEGALSDLRKEQEAANGAN